jgi:hypothetical protein
MPDLRQFRVRSPIAEIVHDIDLKDGKFGRQEAAGIALLLEGIAAVNPGDESRIARSSAVLDDLYQYLRARHSAAKDGGP